MAELTESYIKGFVETCFKAGVHEKQAAAMLDLVAESSAMEKSAAPSFWKGVSQLIKGTGNVVGGAGNAIFGSGASVLKPVGKGISWINDKYMVQPIKHYTKNKNYLAALTHAGTFGALPPALGLTAFQNWRANSDSSIADAINDYLGSPELLVFGRGGNGSSGISTKTYSPNSIGGARYTSTDSPMNIPGTTSYTPGEAILAGTAAASGALPERARELVEKRKGLMTALKSLKDNSSKSESATVRARSGGDGAADLRRQIEDVDAQINEALLDHNRQVGINNQRLAQDRADAVKNLSDARRRDAYQSEVGFNNSDKNLLEKGVNSALEAIGIRDTDSKAVRRAAELKSLGEAVNRLNNQRDEKLIDVAKATSDIARITGGTLY